MIYILLVSMYAYILCCAMSHSVAWYIRFLFTRTTNYLNVKNYNGRDSFYWPIKSRTNSTQLYVYVYLNNILPSIACISSLENGAKSWLLICAFLSNHIWLTNYITFSSWKKIGLGPFFILFKESVSVHWLFFNWIFSLMFNTEIDQSLIINYAYFAYYYCLNSQAL